MKWISLNALKSIGFATIFSLLFFSPTGCGEELGTEKTSNRESIKVKNYSSARRSSEISLNEILSEGDVLSDLTIEEKSKILSKESRAQEIILKREVNPAKLSKAAELIYDIIKKTRPVNIKMCESKTKLDPKGICNSHAKLYARISEIRYYQGDLLPLNDLDKRVEYFTEGTEIGERAKRYNFGSVEALFWKASNLGAWAETSNKKYSKLRFLKMSEICKAAGAAESLLLEAKKIDPNFEVAGIWLTLGRIYHLTPSRCLENKDGTAAADYYLTEADKMNKHKHHLPHYYLFQFYRDNQMYDGAIKEAMWLYKNLIRNEKPTKFTRDFPIYASREYLDVLDFFNSDEYERNK